LDDAPFEALRPSLEQLIVDVDEKKQRAAADLLAGLLGGTIRAFVTESGLTFLLNRFETLAHERTRTCVGLVQAIHGESLCSKHQG
jgi:hypothetical protein